ncbi:MAG TPA: outer membrane beta-barrel protein [Gammaproteobacteria bacterium]
MAAILALAAGAAMAQERDTDSGPYLGIGLGDFSSAVDRIEDLDDVDDVGLDFDDESATKLFAGWRFNRFLAVQLDYIDFGESTASLGPLSIQSDSSGWAPAIVGTLPIGPLELFARAGMIFYDVDIDAPGRSLIDASGEDPIYSAGIGITLLGRLSLRAEYEEIDIDELDEADSVWISAAWRF